jgi:hypothetical protein
MKLFGKELNPAPTAKQIKVIATLDISRLGHYEQIQVRRILNDASRTRRDLDSEWLLISAFTDCFNVANISRYEDKVYIAKPLNARNVWVPGETFKRACLSIGEFRDPEYHDLVRIHGVVNPQIIDLVYGNSQRLIKVRHVYSWGFKAYTTKGIRSFRWENVEKVDFFSGASALRDEILEFIFDGYHLSMRTK